ncbi:MAG: alpha/beta hydrolase fold domain-containing protein [Gemmataceae bacterium]
MKRLLSCLVVLISFAPAQGQVAVDDVVVEKDVVYGKGGDVELKLDLARPKEGEGPFPCIVCIHGGGWRSGSRQSLGKTIEVFARRGYVAATISYRLAPGAKFPSQIEDCKAAVRFLRGNAKKYHINPERIGCVGFSAGGHLCCLLGTCDKDAKLEGAGGNADQSSRVQAVVSFFGPTDLTKKTWNKDVEDYLILPFFGDTIEKNPELYKKASPITHASKDDPPFLFFHGDQDMLVGVRQSQVLCDKLKECGVEAKLVVLEGEGHGWKGDKLTDTIKQTLEFFDAQLKK